MKNHLTSAQRHNKRQDEIWNTYQQQQADFKKELAYLEALQSEPSNGYNGLNEAGIIRMSCLKKSIVK